MHVVSMPDVLDLSLMRLHRWRRAQRGGDAVLKAAVVSLGVAAAAVMLVRLGFPSLVWLVWPLTVAGFLTPLLMLPRALRQRDQAADLAGLLDLQLNTNGVAMALAAMPSEQRDAGWMARLRRPLDDWQPPAFHWAKGKLSLAALGMLLCAVMIPQAQFRPVTPSTTASFFSQTGDRLADLTGANLLPPEQADILQKRFEELKANAERTGMDQATWEGLARLKEDLTSAAQQSGRRLAEALAAAEHAAKPPETKETPEIASEKAAAMAQQLAELAAQAPGLVPKLAAGADADALKAALQQAAAQGKLSAEQLAALEKLGLQPAAGPPQQLNEQQALDLAKRLVDELAKRSAKLGKCDGNGEEGFDLLLAEARGRPGRGGVGRGPGHTDHPQELDVERFPVGGVVGLAPGARLNADGSVTLAEQVREPDVDAATAEAGRRAAAQQFDPTAADARRATTAPRHRAAVQQYFGGE